MEWMESTGHDDQLFHTQYLWSHVLEQPQVHRSAESQAHGAVAAHAAKKPIDDRLLSAVEIMCVFRVLADQRLDIDVIHGDVGYLQSLVFQDLVLRIQARVFGRFTRHRERQLVIHLYRIVQRHTDGHWLRGDVALPVDLVIQGHPQVQRALVGACLQSDARFSHQ